MISFAEIIRTTQSGDRLAVWVTWHAAEPFVTLTLEHRNVEGTVAGLVDELAKEPHIPAWFKDCDEVIFPPLGIIFLGPKLEE